MYATSHDATKNSNQTFFCLFLFLSIFVFRILRMARLRLKSLICSSFSKKWLHIFLTKLSTLFYFRLSSGSYVFLINITSSTFSSNRSISFLTCVYVCSSSAQVSAKIFSINILEIKNYFYIIKPVAGSNYKGAAFCNSSISSPYLFSGIVNGFFSIGLINGLSLLLSAFSRELLTYYISDSLGVFGSDFYWVIMFVKFNFCV